MLSDQKEPAKADRVNALIAEMSLGEKVGQMVQVSSDDGTLTDTLRDNIRGGRIGSVLNQVNPDVVAEMQRIARDESRLGIPLLIGRDVIHGFNTVLPIPLGQAASWNRELVQKGARYSAMEAASRGVNWTFAPMLDVSRDPRWGRIAESLGEDPYLASELGAAMVRGFQTDDLTQADSILSCAKHFAGYGATESGRDYNSANIPDTELHNTYFPPFQAALAAGVQSVMTSFSDVNGEPPTASVWLLRKILREKWGFPGFVVSDWGSINELVSHGVAENDCEAAQLAVNAGVNMDMVSNVYASYLQDLVEQGIIDEAWIDEMVAQILGVKFKLGLFEASLDTVDSRLPTENHLNMARQLALESVVLLKNDQDLLPLDIESSQTIAVIGPLADDGYEQMGTWVFDGDAELSQTVLDALKDSHGNSTTVRHVRALDTTRSYDAREFDHARTAARESDVVLLVLGEESILSGEAHCRSDIRLPGAQEALIEAIVECGKPIVLVIMAGRPLVLDAIVDKVDAILFAWHPGSMGGPAIVDLLFGDAVPSGKLPITFPRAVGQIPIFYSHRNTGRPPSKDTVTHVDDIEARASQTSIGNQSFHLDVDPSPQYCFGYGLSYTEFEYSELTLQPLRVKAGSQVEIDVCVTNTGSREGEEIVQLYTRDPVASLARPIRELKDFCRIKLAPGERRHIHFSLPTDILAFFDRDGRKRLEPGRFQLWVGGSSEADLIADFELVG